MNEEDRQKLYADNEALAQDIATKFWNKYKNQLNSISYDDLAQEAKLLLWEAILSGKASSNEKGRRVFFWLYVFWRMHNLVMKEIQRDRTVDLNGFLVESSFSFDDVDSLIDASNVVFKKLHKKVFQKSDKSLLLSVDRGSLSRGSGLDWSGLSESDIESYLRMVLFGDEND